MSVTVVPGLPRKGVRPGAGLTVNIDGKTKVHHGYKTVNIDGPDTKHTKEILEEHFPGTKVKGLENVEKQEREQRDGEAVKFANGHRCRLSNEHAHHAVNHMRRALPNGPPASRPTFTIPAYVKTMPDGTKRIVREGDPDY